MSSINSDDENEEKIKQFHEFGLDDRILKVGNYSKLFCVISFNIKLHL